MPPPCSFDAFRSVWPRLLALIAGLAAAQPSVAADGLHPSIILRYSSMMSDYRPYSEQPVQAWRETNDEVARIGGWRAYAREMNTGRTDAGGMNAGELTAPSATGEADGTYQHPSGKHEGHKP